MGQTGSWGPRLIRAPGHSFLCLFTCGIVTLVQLQPAPAAHIMAKPLSPLSRILLRAPGTHGSCLWLVGARRCPFANCAFRRNPFPSPAAATTFLKAPCLQKANSAPKGAGPRGHQPPPSQGAHLHGHQPSPRKRSETPLLLLGWTARQTKTSSARPTRP